MACTQHKISVLTESNARKARLSVIATSTNLRPQLFHKCFGKYLSDLLCTVVVECRGKCPGKMEGASCSYSEPAPGLHSQRNPCSCSGQRRASAPLRPRASNRTWRREQELKQLYRAHKYRAQRQHSRAKVRAFTKCF